MAGLVGFEGVNCCVFVFLFGGGGHYFRPSRLGGSGFGIWVSLESRTCFVDRDWIEKKKRKKEGSLVNVKGSLYY